MKLTGTIAAAFVLILVVLAASPANAQEAGGASVVIVPDGSIIVDGSLDEWVDLEPIVSVDGPQPSTDPDARGRLIWRVAADATTVYFSATVTDDQIVVGDDPDRYWNDDSIEFYLNLSGNLAATSYEPAIAQIRLSPVDIGNPDPAGLTLTGNGADQFPVTGTVFETDDGWGTEIAVDVSLVTTPTNGESLGLQVQLNGSSGSDRDIKVIWSPLDTNDTSFQDPSVFGQAVFVGLTDEADTGVAAEETTEPEREVVDPELDEAGTSVTEVESETSGEVITGEEQQRSLLIAAVASSIAVLLGGLWFERKRRTDEARHAAVAGSASAALESGEELDDEEYEELLQSILDDGEGS